MSWHPNSREGDRSRVVSIYREQRIGKILADLGKLSEGDVVRVEAHRARTRLRFGEAARQLGLVTEADVQFALARQFDFALLATPWAYPLSDDLITAHRPFGTDSEVFRTLRSQLLLLWFEAGRRALSLVGPAANVGCSYVAGNLAVCFAQIGARTLLIDADLRRPRLGAMFGLSSRFGLSDLLVERGASDQCIVEDVVPGLDLVSAGTVPPNPQELLNRPAFGEHLDAWRRSYDVVLLDSSPGNESADPQIVAARAGGAVVIARASRTRTADAAALSDMIVGGGAEIVGSVLNEY